MHNHRFPEMTFTALNNRADSTAIMDTVAELIGGDDTREVTVFLRHEPVPYTPLRAHETKAEPVCRSPLEKKKDQLV